MKPTKLTEDQIGNAVSQAIEDAVSFIDSEIAPDRIRAQKYFDGKTKVKHEEGRSKVVATKCRDTVRAIKPALMRVFLQSGSPVEFTPRNAQAVQAAEQATKYAKYVFNRNNGFDVLSDVIHDALVKKVGIAKAYYDETEHIEIDEYTGLTEDQFNLLESDESAEVIEFEITQDAQIDQMGMMVSPAMYDAKVAMTSSRGEIKIKSIAPEDFFVDRDAISLEDYYVCGHKSEGRVGDLVSMGFDFDKVFELGGVGGVVDEEEDFVRRGYDSASMENSIDPSMRKIEITEAYMKMDIEGTGIPRLYKFLCAGTDYEVLDYELCDYNPFAVFEIDPEPHTFFGRSLVDIIIDDQDAATSLMRGLLDNIAMINNPRIVFNEQAVEQDDVQNNEIGAMIRATDINQIREMTIGSSSQMTLPAMQMFDEAVRAKTGIGDGAAGLNADALQSQTAAGVNAAVTAATAVGELMARVLAEGGMKQLFKTIATIARQNPNPDEMMRIDGEFVPVDPRSWGVEMDMETTVGIGHNKHEERMMMLQMMQQQQMQVFGTYGPQNGLVTLTNIRNTAADLMTLGGLPNVDRYLQPMNAQIEQQMQQQAAQAAQQQGQQNDPNAAFLQTEQMKAQTRAQVDMQKAAMEHQRKMLDMAKSDDLSRDKMAQDLLVDAAKILGQYGTSVDVAQIGAQQNAPRNFNGGQV
tara:strand:+ start:325 stop:2400 length:2076 start_codon:yes stop_codon:yes gene_type:complete